MSFLKAVLIADDLTGSLDSIAPFAARGLTCVTLVAPVALDLALALSPDVVSVNLGTRELAPDIARARAEAACLAVKDVARPETIWMKKIDSRLKGPISAEIAGMAKVLLLNRAVLCPAIPELGRMVTQGHLWGSGVDRPLPVAATVNADLPCEVPDATSDADLDRLLDDIPPGTLLAGARGLAAALARRLCPDRPPAPARIRPGPMGIAIGSRDPVTLAQVAMLQAAGAPRWFPAPDGQVSDITEQGDFLIQAVPGPGAASERVAARLADGVLRSLSGLRTLVLTGGETAAAVLDAAGVRVLGVAGEIKPGLPLCRSVDRPDFPDLVTKSGGFGPPDTLVRLWQAAHPPEGYPPR
jgi:D-threonate/D-erythronate kinase